MFNKVMLFGELRLGKPADVIEFLFLPKAMIDSSDSQKCQDYGDICFYVIQLCRPAGGDVAVERVSKRCQLRDSTWKFVQPCHVILVQSRTSITYEWKVDIYIE